MNCSDVLTLYRYNDWANGRVAEALQPLSADALNRDLGGSFRSIRATFAHVVSAEWVWLERWRGLSISAVPDWVSGGDLPLLLARLSEVQANRATYLGQLTESMLSQRLDFRYISGAAASHELSDLLLHAVNHSTYHRGQLASMLRAMGAAPPATDFVVFKTASA
jgi:uncharacterized damage-inducible protein DinB